MVTCADAVKEAVKSFDRVVSAREVINYIYKKYPNRPWKESTINAHVIGCSVNHSSSKHYPSFPKFLFYVGPGRYRMYNPDKDGKWIVDYKGARIAGDEIEESETEDTLGVSFNLERDLEEQIVKNLDQIEDGLRIYSREGLDGRQFNTNVGRIDILTLDKNNNLVVIELKAGRASSSVVGQILAYINWVKRNLSKGKSVRGIIIADDFDEKVKHAVSSLPNVELKAYKVNFEFRNVSLD